MSKDEFVVLQYGDLPVGFDHRRVTRYLQSQGLQQPNPSAEEDAFFTLHDGEVIGSVQIKCLVQRNNQKIAQIHGYLLGGAYKNGVAEFKALPELVQWAQHKACHAIFWAHSYNLSDIEKMTGHDSKNFYRNTELYKSFKMSRDFLFINSNNRKRNYVHWKPLQDLWVPDKDLFEEKRHDGELF
jgi:hypothetical protein